MTAELEVFTFRHSLFEVKADLGATQLVVKASMRTVVVPLDTLEQLYVRAERYAEHHELLLTWRTAKGKLKRGRIFSDPDAAGFTGLIEALLARYPHIDQRDLTVHEAYARSGSRQLEWIAIPAMMGVGWLVVALLFSPLMIHGLDTGHAAVAASDLVGNTLTLTTRNLDVQGRLSLPDAARGVASATSKEALNTVWVPLVPHDWQRGEAVHLVLEIKGESPAGLATIARADSFEGIVRDVGWESLSEGTRRAVEKAGVALAPGARVMQYRANPKDDLYLSMWVLGFLGLLTFGAAVGLYSRSRSKLG